jgi:translation initiation factor 4E
MEVDIAPRTMNNGASKNVHNGHMPPVEAPPPSKHITDADNDGDNDSNINGNDDKQPANSENTTDQDAVTVFMDPSNFNMKHPLQNRWSLWYDYPGKKTGRDTWADNLKKVVTFDTVEDFWGVFNNIAAASTLVSGSNYHLFKDGIEPKWEDPVNSRGGKWVVSIPPKTRSDSLDKLWMWLVLGCIGETFDDVNEVCGVVVSIRKQADRLALWTKDATNEVAVKNIGRKVKIALELPDHNIIGYQSHADSMKHGSSFNNKNRYEV